MDPCLFCKSVSSFGNVNLGVMKKRVGGWKGWERQKRRKRVVKEALKSVLLQQSTPSHDDVRGGEMASIKGANGQDGLL